MSIPPPQERPDLYDSYDLPERDFKPGARYLEATLPSWMSETVPQQSATVGATLSGDGEVQMMDVGPVVEMVQLWPVEAQVTVVSLSAHREGDGGKLRQIEINALRELADQLERNVIEPGRLVVNITA